MIADYPPESPLLNSDVSFLQPGWAYLRPEMFGTVGLTRFTDLSHSRTAMDGRQNIVAVNSIL